MPSQLFEKIYKGLGKIIDLNQRQRLIVGLSGGPDSVFLLHFLAWASRSNCIDTLSAHLDHGWRENSSLDAEFCKKTCDGLGVQIVVGHAREYEQKCKQNGSLEELGRKMRRAFFEKVKTEHNANFVALAHHAQDQEETFFLRLLRGSSLTGLVGMQPISGFYIRPLLDLPRKEILAWLNDQKIPFITDPSNNETKFLRNRIRHYVLPALRTTDSRFEQKFADTLKTLQEEHCLLQHFTDSAFAAIFSRQSQQSGRQPVRILNRLIGNQKLFLTYHKTLQRRVLIRLLCLENAKFNPSRAFLDEIIKFLSFPSGGTHTLGKCWKLVKRKGFFWLHSGESSLI